MNTTVLYTTTNGSSYAREVYDCPDCKGRGEVLEAHQRPWGHSEVLVTCELCEGNGYFDETDYIILKLQGKV